MGFFSRKIDVNVIGLPLEQRPDLKRNLLDQFEQIGFRPDTPVLFTRKGEVASQKIPFSDVPDDAYYLGRTTRIKPYTRVQSVYTVRKTPSLFRK